MARKIGLVILVFSLLLAAGCNISQNSNQTSLDAENKTHINVDKVEIIHFHATNQCYTCKTVGQYAEETVSTYYADEVKDGKVTFAHLNLELPENAKLVKKYNVTGASLWIGVYDKDEFHSEQNVNVWYKVSDKTDYMTYLKSIVDKRLAGDYS